MSTRSSPAGHRWSVLARDAPGVSLHRLGDGPARRWPRHALCRPPTQRLPQLGIRARRASKPASRRLAWPRIGLRSVARRRRCPWRRDPRTLEEQIVQRARRCFRWLGDPRGVYGQRRGGLPEATDAGGVTQALARRLQQALRCVGHKRRRELVRPRGGVLAVPRDVFCAPKHRAADCTGGGEDPEGDGAHGQARRRVGSRDGGRHRCPGHARRQESWRRRGGRVWAGSRHVIARKVRYKQRWKGG
mmetsp:Transcript_21883/g.62029  ORF Transcript_21883/g.62029 Transcript_21883/m.62029 type:complete len:246 (+) Transcript_21883:12-749(+)